MTKLRQATSLLVLAFLAGSFLAPLDAVAAQAKPKPMNELLIGKQPLTISPAQRKSVLSTKGSLSFSCNGVFCACSGDLDCNDMFSHNVCGPRAICIDNVCYCSRN